MFRALSLAPLPVTLLILSFLSPTEFSMFVAGLRLPQHRVALLILIPFALMTIMSSRDTRLHTFDALFLAFCAWILYVYHSHDGWPGLVYGGSLALEAFGGYIVARAYVRDTPTLQATLRVMMLAIITAALIALPETLLGKNFTHDFLASVTGYHHPTAVEQRLGLTRAYGTFDDPIHYGTFCAALLAMLWFAERRISRQRKRAGIIAGATVLGVSSAPILCLALQIGMIIWERLTRAIPSRTMITFAIIAGLYIGVSLVSNRGPIAIIATGMTLDSWTGFYRLQIWEHGLNNVSAHPWTGIGLAEWERSKWMVSSTVDAFWLVTAMRSGIPAFLILAAAIALMARAVFVNSRRFGDLTLSNMAMGWLMSLTALCLIGATVHYWNVLHAYFFFFLGLGGAFADPRKSRRMPAVRRNKKQRVKPTRRRPELPRPPPLPQPVGFPPVANARMR